MTATRDVVRTPLFRRHVRRPRLTALLDEATAQSLLLVAPAGYGKTTLAREWLQGRDDAVWFHATGSSADLGAFSAGLVDIVQPVMPGVGERVKQRVRVADDPLRLARPLAEMLAEELEPWPEGAVIVLDDYHLLAESRPVETFIDRLLLLAPIRLLVTSRRRPAWATARRFLYGEATEIGRDQLAMTTAEASQVLEGRTTHAVRTLVRQADGWPVVIGLASLSADSEIPEEQASESLFRYFAEEVFRQEPPEVQRFMLAASVPLSFDIRLAREVLAFDNPGPLLDRLRDENLVLEASGDLRFHPLLRQFLRTELATYEHETFAIYAEQVLADARTQRRWEEAFALSLELGRIRDAARTAGRAARDLLAAGQSETLEAWLAACGEAAVTEPAAALASAELLIRKGEMSAAAAVARDTIARVPVSEAEHAWGCNIAGRALHFLSENHLGFEMFTQARDVATEEADSQEALWGLIITANEIAPEALDGYLVELDARFSHHLVSRCRHAMGSLFQAEYKGAIAGAWERLAVLARSADYIEDPVSRSGLLLLCGWACVLRGAYGDGFAFAERALRICTEDRLRFGTGGCLSCRASAETGLRRYAQASVTLRALERSATGRADPFFQIELLMLRARLLALQGRVDDAIATRESLPGRPCPDRPLGVYYANLSMILAAAGHAEESSSFAHEARELRGSNVEVHLCTVLAKAIATATSNAQDGFVTEAAEALLACAEANYFDGVVLAYRLCPDLLQAAEASSVVRRNLEQVLGESRDYDLARRYHLRSIAPEADEPFGMLTPREREVLSLLAAGLTNAEIAQRLFISTSTAKVHVHRILKKLGARSRLEAAIRVREMEASESA